MPKKNKKRLPLSNQTTDNSANRSVAIPTDKEKEDRTIRFFYAVLGFLLALTLFFPGEQPERTGSAHLPCLLWLIVALCWVIRFRRNTQENTQRTPLLLWTDRAFFAFFIWVCLSALINLFDGGGYRPTLNKLSVWFTFATAYFLFRESLHSDRNIRAMLGVITAIMFAQALTGIEQYFVSIPAMQRQFEANPELVAASVSPTIKPGSADWEHFTSRIETARPTGTYPLSNSLGGLLACGLLIALLGGGTQEVLPQKTLKKIVGYSLIAVIGSAFLLTKCRSGLVAVCLGLVLWGIFDLRQRWKFESVKRPLITGVLLTLAVFVALMFLPGKGLLDGAKRSLGFRLEYWQASWEMIQVHPLFGCGSGNFKQSYTKYKLPYSSEEIGDPHNFAVEIAAESGLPALFLFFVPFGLLYRQFLRNSKKHEQCQQTVLPSIDKIQNTESFFYGGGCFGCWAAFMFSFNLEAAMSPVAPLAATWTFPFCAWLYHRQNNGSQNSPLVESQPSHSIVIAVIVSAVLLVHLSAAGGFSVTSTAILFWFFIAVVCNQLNEK